MSRLPSATSRAQLLFSDDFTRTNDPGALLAWTSYQGAWTVTGGVMKAGPNTNTGYGFAYTTTNSFTISSAVCTPPLAAISAVI